ncbi:uncharacterized protein TNCV_2221291 [Trichonephila clavipes]|nr:uncharacterized protein TNCV_2221291 [Trichonephila clavipes]
MKEGLIASSYECPKCNEQMGLNERKSVVLDGFEWRCRKKGVNTHDVCRSIRKNSWFSNSATETSRYITTSDIIGEIYFFLENSRGFSELANMITNDAKMVTSLVAENDANLTLPPRFFKFSLNRHYDIDWVLASVSSLPTTHLVPKKEVRTSHNGAQPQERNWI